MNYSSYEFRSKKFIYFLTFHANLGAFVTGMFFVALNACVWEVLATIKAPESSERFNKIALSAAIPFGAIFGAWGASAFAVKRGRRSSLIISDVIAVAACLISVDSSIFLIAMGRLLCGIYVGINWTIIPLYVREVSPPDLSGRSGAIFRIMFCAGILLTFILSLGFTLKEQDGEVYAKADPLWKVIFLLPILFCAIRTIIFIFIIRLETPRYYISQSDQENAMLALAQIYTDDQVKSIYSQESRFEDTSNFTEVLSPRFKRQASIVFLLILVNEFMGTNALTFYSTELFLDAGDKNSEANFFKVRPLNVYFSLVRFLATVVGIALIDKVGRRPLMLYGTVFTTLVGALTAITSFFPEHLLIEEEILMIVFTGLQSMSLNLVLPIYTAELLPSYGMGLQVIFQMICILLVTLVFPYTVALEYAFIVFALVGVVSFIPMLKMVKETKGKTLNEIYRLFHAERDSGLLDEEVVEEEFSPYYNTGY